MKFKLSHYDILNKKFKSTANGYDPEEVDSFLDLALSDYKLMAADIQKYEEQINYLKEQNAALKLDNNKLEMWRSVNSDILNSIKQSDISPSEILDRVQKIGDELNQRQHAKTSEKK